MKMITSLKLKTMLCIIAVISVVLSACGFKLAADNKGCCHIKDLIIITADDCDAFIINLSSEFRECGVSVKLKIDHRESEGDITGKLDQLDLDRQMFKLLITLPSIQEQIYSYNYLMQITRMQITSKVDYKLFDTHNSLIEQRSISRMRIYQVNHDQMLSNANEKSIIIDELHNEIIAALINKLCNVNRISKLHQN